MIALCFIVILLCWPAEDDEIAEHFYVLASGVFGSSFAALWVFILWVPKNRTGAVQFHISGSYIRFWVWNPAASILNWFLWSTDWNVYERQILHATASCGCSRENASSGEVSALYLDWGVSWNSASGSCHWQRVCVSRNVGMLYWRSCLFSGFPEWTGALFGASVKNIHITDENILA